MTISSIYIKPGSKALAEIVDGEALTADLVAGDCNDEITCMNKKGVYHYKGMSLCESRVMRRRVSDHSAFILNQNALSNKRRTKDGTKHR